MAEKSPQNSDREGKLSALYYPYSRCVDLRSLKTFTLLFEELVFTDPLEENFREFLLFSDRGCKFVPKSVRNRWHEVQESWDYLRDVGCVSVVDPIPLINEYDGILTASYASDISDEQFVRTAHKEGKPAGPWKTLASRIPPTINKSFLEHDSLEGRTADADKKKHVFSDYQIGVFAWEQYDHDGFREYVLEKLGDAGAKDRARDWGRSKARETIDTSPLDPYDQIFLSGGGTCTEDGRPFGMHPYSYVDTVKHRTGEPIRILSFAQGASMAISQSLLIAELKGLVPVTDNALHQRLLAQKHKNALCATTAFTRDGIAQPSLDVSQTYSILARNVLLKALSPALLDSLSMKQIVNYRNENRESLERFWARIRALSHDLSDVPLGQDTNSAIIKLIDKEVIPELHSLQDKLEISKKKMFGGIVSKLTTSIPVSTAVSVFAGLSPGQILAVGSSAALSALSLSVPSIVSRWQQKAELNQHWLAFALNLKEGNA